MSGLELIEAIKKSQGQPGKARFASNLGLIFCLGARFGAFSIESKDFDTFSRRFDLSIATLPRISGIFKTGLMCRRSA